MLRQGGEVADAGRPGVFQGRGSRPRSRLERLGLTNLGGERHGKLRELRAAALSVADGVLALPGGLLDVVQSRHGVVERARAEQDGERVRLAFLVQGAEVSPEEALRHA